MVKEEYLRRAILLMDRHPMVSILERKIVFAFSTMTLSIRRGKEPPLIEIFDWEPPLDEIFDSEDNSLIAAGGPPAAISELSSESKLSS